MNQNKLVKRVVIAGGFLFLCAAPRPSFGQGVPVRPTRVAPASARNRNRVAPPDLLAGLTLTSDQQAKIDQIRADTKSQLASVVKDEKLAPDVKDAMLNGYQRIENAKIVEVLTPEQQKDVQKRIAAWRAAERQKERPSPPPPGPPKDSQPK